MLFEIQTVQTLIFKSLIEVLKELFLEIKFVITPSGISANAMDTAATSFTDLFMENTKFEKYLCENGSYNVGIDLHQFWKILRHIPNASHITLFMTETEKDVLKILVLNPKDGTKMTYNFKLMTINKEKIVLPKVDFDIVATMPTSTFNKYVKYMADLDTKMEIQGIGNSINLATTGIYAGGCLEIPDTCEGVIINRKCDKGKIVKSCFKIKLLNNCLKCSNLSANIELNLKSDFALLIKYSIGSLGRLSIMIMNDKPEKKAIAEKKV